MKRKRKKARILALLLLAVGLASPPTASAQLNDSGGGLFGRGGRQGASGSVTVENQSFGSSGSTLFNQGFGGTHGGLDNQDFGGTHGGITNQGFDVPIGSGLLVLAAAGAGYASLKKRDKKINQQKRNEQ